MPKRYSSAELITIKLIKMVEDDGWTIDRISGSYHHFQHTVKKGIVTIPHPVKDK